MSQRTHCDVCDGVASADRPIMEERSISLRESIPKGGSTGFRVNDEWVRFHYYFSLPTGDYHSPKRIDICDECAGRGYENAYRGVKD